MADDKKATTDKPEKEFPEQLSEAELRDLRATKEERARLADYLSKHRAAATRADNAAKRMRATREAYAALVLQMKGRRYDELRHEEYERRERLKTHPVPDYPDPNEAIKKMMGPEDGGAQ